MLPMITTSDELAAKEKAEAVSLKTEPVVSGLSQHIKGVWEKAKRAKVSIGNEMIDCLRQRNGEYGPEKLAEIRKIRSSEVYLMLTNTKCRAGEAWTKEIILPPGQRPFDIEPTPIPTIPVEIETEIRQTFFREAISQILTGAVASGQPIDTQMIISQVKAMMPEFERRVKKLIFDKTKEQVDEIEKAVDDSMIEGGWYGAINDCIYDFITLPACILKGPVVRKETIRKQVTDPGTGLMKVVYEDKNVPQYNRASPIDIFPVKDSTGVNDGDLVERVYWRPDQLSSMIGLPGYDTKEIEAVLNEYDDGNLKEWTTDIDQARAEQEQHRKDGDHQTDTTKIPALEWWGSVLGKKLSDWGLEGIEPNKIYHAVAWLVGDHVIGAKINKEPNGEKPYSGASFEMLPGSFWGRAIPYLVRDIQNILNAAARALVNNVGIASGPQIEVNVDRFPQGFDFSIWPYKQWPSNESTMSDKPALTFYSPPLIADKLINVMSTFSKMADDQVIPAYAHGDPNVGGGGNTASGLSMLFTAASRNMKTAIKNFDDHIIAPSVTRQFFFEIEHGEHKGTWCDIKIVAKGSSSLTVKEQQAIRIGEFARDTANPIDLQITGIEGRKYLLKTRAQALNIDADKVVQGDNLMGPMNPINPAPTGPNMPGTTNLGPDGNPVQGTDTRMFNGDR